MELENPRAISNQTASSPLPPHHQKSTSQWVFNLWRPAWCPTDPIIELFHFSDYLNSISNWQSAFWQNSRAKQLHSWLCCQHGNHHISVRFNLWRPASCKMFLLLSYLNFFESNCSGCGQQTFILPKRQGKAIMVTSLLSSWELPNLSAYSTSGDQPLLFKMSYFLLLFIVTIISLFHILPYDTINFAYNLGKHQIICFYLPSCCWSMHTWMDKTEAINAWWLRIIVHFLYIIMCFMRICQVNTCCFYCHLEITWKSIHQMPGYIHDNVSVSTTNVRHGWIK